MNNTLGKHLIIDFYNCKSKYNDARELQALVDRAFELAEKTVDTIAFSSNGDELTCIATGSNAHICIHYYEQFAYTAVDIYSFDTNFKSSQIMGIFKNLLHSDRIKATSVRRGDFGSIRDMRPHRKSKITTVRRVKNTGVRIKTTSTKMFQYLRHPQKTRRSRRHNP